MRDIPSDSEFLNFVAFCLFCGNNVGAETKRRQKEDNDTMVRKVRQRSASRHRTRQ